jgi:hypothetical protein
MNQLLSQIQELRFDEAYPILTLSNSSPVFHNLPLHIKIINAFSIKIKVRNKPEGEQYMHLALSRILPTIYTND